MEQVVPALIGHHEVICLLGQGGMAQVYLAFVRGPASVRKLVVVKRIRDELAHDSQFISMFLDEARLAAQLNHPNVVQTYEVVADSENYSLTMEYLEGQSFEEILKRIQLGLFPLEEHLWILTQVLAGLQYAHALADYSGAPLGVVHRDVSPANIFVTYNGDVKLLDFGVARACGAICVTEAGIFKGKVSYCAPEQLQSNGPPDARADIYAAGILLWEALAGRRLGNSSSFQELAQARLHGKEPKIRDVRPDAPRALADICDRAMAFAPAERYLTAADFQRDLEKYLEKTGSRVGRSQVADLMRRHFETERRAIQKRIEEHLAAKQESESREVSPRPALPPGIALGVVPAREVPAREALTRKDRSDRGASPAPKPQSSPGAAYSTVHKPLTLPIPIPAPVPPANDGSPVESSRKRFHTLLIVAVVGGVAGGMAGWWRKAARTAEAAFVPTTLTAPAVAPAKPEPPPSPPEPAVAPDLDNAAPTDTIRLDIQVRPTTSSLAFDDRRVAGNRLQAEVARDQTTHLVTASAPGYLPFRQTVSFSSDVLLDVELKRGLRPAHKRGKLRGAQIESKPKSKWKSKTGAKSTLKSGLPSSFKGDFPEDLGRKPAPADQRLEPGSSLEGPEGRRSRVRIDESDPYGRGADPFAQ